MLEIRWHYGPGNTLFGLIFFGIQIILARNHSRSLRNIFFINKNDQQKRGMLVDEGKTDYKYRLFKQGDVNFSGQTCGFLRYYPF